MCTDKVNPNEEYTPKMLAATLGKSVSCIYNWINNGLKVSRTSRTAGISILGSDYLNWKGN